MFSVVGHVNLRRGRVGGAVKDLRGPRFTLGSLTLSVSEKTSLQKEKSGVTDRRGTIRETTRGARRPSEFRGR